MRRTPLHRVSLLLLVAGICGLLVAGCGSDDDSGTSGGESGQSAQERVDLAIDDCTTKAQDLGGGAGSALEAACTTIGANVKQTLETGGENVDQALSTISSSCRSGVEQLPAGKAQDALSSLCDAIGSAE